jgi:hypothetical protein
MGERPGGALVHESVPGHRSFDRYHVSRGNDPPLHESDRQKTRLGSIPPATSGGGRRICVSVPSELWVLPRPRRDCYVGSFPNGFEQKLDRLLGHPPLLLLPFAGLAGCGFKGEVHTVDLNATTGPTWVADAHDLHWISDDTYDASVLDPPFSSDESYELFGTPPVHPARYITEAVRVTKPGGHVVLYHVRQPARPAGTTLVHRVAVLTRVNHTARVCFVYRKQ